MSKPSWQLKGSWLGPAADVDFGAVLGGGVDVGTSGLRVEGAELTYHIPGKMEDFT